MLILDTAGRLHIDEDLMHEVATIRQRTQPQEVLLVVDAMTGQDAVRVADEFNKAVGLTGLILTKMDGDARGGAALSVREVTGVPIKFMGTGEKLDALEPFYPDRLATRILGMGDVMSLIERAREQIDEKQALQMTKKMGTGNFDLEDFLGQMQQIKKMGPLSQLLEMIPGMGKALSTPEVREALEGDQMKMTEAIILSMTAAGAPQSRDHQRQPQAPHRQGQRHHAAGREPAAGIVQAVAEDDEADDGHAAGRRRAQGPLRWAGRPGWLRRTWLVVSSKRNVNPYSRWAWHNQCAPTFLWPCRLSWRYWWERAIVITVQSMK